jgi:UDP-2,4-diacetamido-2,4,6-trideoxy-beta-L-altropyranose hydrolase
MSQLIFRADGNPQIGMGHVMRCLALAKMLDDTFRFAIITPAPEVVRLIEEANGTVVPLKTDDISEFLTVITANDIAILDGYAFEETYQRTVREVVAKLVFIDDLVAGHQVADVVINHAGGITQSDYDAEPYTRFCLGPNYALLRPEFLKTQTSSLAIDESIQSRPVFVSLGGSDQHNTSLAVLEALRQVDAAQMIRIILGPFHPDRAAIEAFREQLPNLTILQNLSAAQMVSELGQCSLAITACSTVAYEVCAVNRPLIGIVTAENQDRIAQFLSDEKLALSVNFPTLLTRLTPVISLENMLKLAIQGFQFSPHAAIATLANQRQFFDGRSPERFRALFDTLC